MLLDPVVLVKLSGSASADVDRVAQHNYNRHSAGPMGGVAVVTDRMPLLLPVNNKQQASHSTDLAIDVLSITIVMIADSTTLSVTSVERQVILLDVVRQQRRATLPVL